MRFEFATAARVVFGSGTLREVGPAAKALGARSLVVTGATPGRAAALIEALHAAGGSVCVFPFSGEPTTDTVIEGLAVAKSESCEIVIGFGGGSVLDAAKAIAALLTNPGDLLDYLEVVGRAQPLRAPAAPCVTIPTTSGTGAEVTRNSVLASPAHRVKASLRSPLMLPRLAVVDPELAHSLPPEATATTGMDALTQLIEPYLSQRANPLVDALCVEGIRRAARSLRRAVDNGADGAAREDMALASLFGGLALANAGLGAVHGLAAPLGGMFPAPHGATCAALLPHVFRANLQALRERQPDSSVLPRCEEVARLLTGRPQACAEDAVTWIADLCQAIRIKPLGCYGLQPADIPTVVEKAMQASSMKANPLPLTASELAEVLAAAR